jgi:hypothetical protein
MNQFLVQQANYLYSIDIFASIDLLDVADDFYSTFNMGEEL